MNKSIWIALFTIMVGGCLGQAPTDDGAAQLAAQLQLQLTSAQDTYIRDVNPPGENQPSHQEVDLTLTLHNRSSEQVVVPVGVRNWYTLKLEGPGAVEVGQQGPQGMWCIPSPNIVVAAGQSHTETLRQIRYYRGRSFAWAWTKPGKYTVTAQAQVQIRGHEVLLHSNPVHFQVVPGEKPRPPRGTSKAVPLGAAVSDRDGSGRRR